MNKPRYFSPLVVVAGCALLALGLTREVQAVASAFVTVTNTSANAVPVTAVDNAVLYPFGQRLFPNVRQYATITVPAGKKLVINSITGFNNSNGSVDALEVGLVSNGVPSGMRIPFLPPPNNGWRPLSNTPVFLVADAGSTVYITVDDGNVNDGAGVNVDVHGFYVPQ